VFHFFEILLEKGFWAIQRFHHLIISERQFSVSNKFYDRNQTLLTVWTAWPDGLGR